MSKSCHTLPLPGCSPEPLMNYLKALGVLRLVSEQADPAARGFWSGDIFHLESSLGEAELSEFFLERYEPTPIVGPWGARSGFFGSPSESSARIALDAIESSSLSRLDRFSSAIREVRFLLASLGLSEKADSSEAKRRLMLQCRARLPDPIIDWLDATFLLLDEDTKYPPLLGTGGNEGSGSYMSGFAQQIVAVVVERQWDHALSPSLFGVARDRLATNQTPGHFSPFAAGGTNAASVSDGSSTTNPWDYVFMLEGALMFAAACVKRLESHGSGALVFPFCVRQSGVGYGSAARDDESHSRAEMWLPLWRRPSNATELRAVFSEGRATVGARHARNGVDFARAICSLGVDRGITDFERYSFQQRNGLSYFAVALGRFCVNLQPQVSLLAELDDWLDRFRREAQADKSPATAGRALRTLEQSILELCRQRSPTRLQNVLIALGACEQVLSKSVKWRQDKYLRPVPLLSPAWLAQAADAAGNTIELRLAASIAGLSGDKGIGALRQAIEPVAFGRPRDDGRRSVFFADDSAAAAAVVWTTADLERNLAAVLMRRIIDAGRTGSLADADAVVFPDRGVTAAALGDVAAFLRGDTDDHRINQLIRGLALLDWKDPAMPFIARRLQCPSDEGLPDATFAILKLCHTAEPMSLGGFEMPVRLDGRIARLLAAGRTAAATDLAGRRLQGVGLPPAFRVASAGRQTTMRRLAALMFPLSEAGIATLALRVLDRSKSTAEDSQIGGATVPAASN